MAHSPPADAIMVPLAVAADRYSISVPTLQTWIKDGKLPAFDKTLGKSKPSWLIKPFDLEALLTKHQHSRNRKQFRSGMREPQPEILVD